MEPAFTQPIGQEETFTVPPGHNTLVVGLREHTWVSVSAADGTVVRDTTSDPMVGFSVAPGTYTILTDGKVERVTSEVREQAPYSLEQFVRTSPAQLRLTSDAPDKHIVDGIGEISADGTSFCTITVEKLTFDGKPLTGTEHNNEIFLRTTGGTVMDNMGKEHIRSLKLKSGRAAFRLVSESSPRLVTVTAFGREPLTSKAEIQIEFV